MAIPTSIADLTWLGPGEPAGAPFARGASAGATIAGAWNNRRQLGMQQAEQAEIIRARRAEEARKAKEAAIQFAGFQDYQAGIASGMKPDEAIKQFGAAMFYKSATFPNFVSAQERSQIAQERAAETANYHTKLLEQRDDIENRIGRNFDRKLGEETRQFGERIRVADEKLAAEKTRANEAEEGRNQRAKELNESRERIKNLEIEHKVKDNLGKMGFQAFIGERKAITDSVRLSDDQKRLKIRQLYEQAEKGLYRPGAIPPAPAAAPAAAPVAGAFESEAAARAAGKKADDIVVLIIEGKPTRVRLK